jgi:arylformamidase
MAPSQPDRSTLDANYNLRAAVPEHQDYFDRYEAASEAWRERCGGRPDLLYGSSPRQAIDLYLPEAGGRPPLLVFIHGGYWQRFDRKAFAFVAEPLRAAGAAVALIGYDLAPAVDMDAIVGQIRRGLGWLYREGATLGYDPARIFVAGHSAGGHLTAMALATDWAAHGLPPDLIKGACAISGIFDLEPIRLCYLNEVLGLDAEQARRNSPLHLPPGPAPCPVTVAVGETETAAFHEQSRAYAGKLAAAGWPCRLVVQPGMHHFESVMSMARADDALVRILAGQMGLAPHAA